MRPPAVIAEELQVYLMGIYQWVENMHHALEAHCDCTELLALSEPVLHNFMSVSDSAFFHIAHTPNIEPIEDASRYFLEHGRYSAEVIETVGTSGLSKLWARSRPFSKYDSNAINPMPSIDHVYHLNSQYAAHLVMICKEPVTEGQEFLFSLLVGPVGTALDYMWRNDNPLKKRYASFLGDVMHASQGLHESALRQAQALGIPLSGLFKVCLVSEPWRASCSTRCRTARPSPRTATSRTARSGAGLAARRRRPGRPGRRQHQQGELPALSPARLPAPLPRGGDQAAAVVPRLVLLARAAEVRGRRPARDPVRARGRRALQEHQARPRLDPVPRLVVGQAKVNGGLA